jgi:hypothetical protein
MKFRISKPVLQLKLIEKRQDLLFSWNDIKLDIQVEHAKKHRLERTNKIKNLMLVKKCIYAPAFIEYTAAIVAFVHEIT